MGGEEGGGSEKGSVGEGRGLKGLRGEGIISCYINCHSGTDAAILFPMASRGQWED